jgi:hypothetical protein
MTRPTRKRAKAAAKYKPARTRVLFVVEAPPDTEDRYFYFEHVAGEDWLWLGLMKALFPHEFGETSTERLRKSYWLSRFRDNGCQLVDAVKDPIDGNRRQRIAAIQSQIPTLISEIREISPEQIVLIKSTVHAALFQPLRQAEFNVVNDESLPFPSTGHQIEFQMKFQNLIDSVKLRITMWVAGVDGCRGGWVAFKIDLSSRSDMTLPAPSSRARVPGNSAQFF